MKENFKPARPRVLMFLIATFSLLFITLIGQAQVIKTDSTRFFIGSKVDLTIEAPYTRGDRVNWPSFTDTIAKSIEILSKTGIDTVTSEGSTSGILRQVISITSFDTGFIVIPPITFDIIRQDGSMDKISTTPLMIEVLKVNVDPAADIKDIKPILRAPYTIRDFLPWIIGLLVLALAVWGIRNYLKNRKKAPVEKPAPKVTRPVWEVAIEKLDALKAEQLWQKGQVKEYYTKLTDIIREYLEARFGLYAAEMTSSEILQATRPLFKDGEAMDSLRFVLFQADMAKFAKAQPGAFENEKSMSYGVEIINRTKTSATEVISK
jgi:hypothetical protein